MYSLVPWDHLCYYLDHMLSLIMEDTILNYSVVPMGTHKLLYKDVLWNDPPYTNLLYNDLLRYTHLRHTLSEQSNKKAHRLWKILPVIHSKPYLWDLHLSTLVVMIPFRTYLYIHVILFLFSLLILRQEMLNKMTFKTTEGFQFWGKTF